MAEENDPASRGGTDRDVYQAPVPTSSRITTDVDESPSEPADAQSDLRYDEFQGVNPENENLEQYFITGDSLDTTRLTPKLKDNDTFNELMAQLRNETSPVAAEKRRSYELMFYSQASAQSGAVTVDALECGARLCASELRAENKPRIDQFVTSLTQSDDFDTRAFIEVIADPDLANGYGESRRIIFSHDPTIDSITLPAEALEPQH